MEERNPLSLDEQVCFALSVASRAIVSCYRDVLEPLGLTHPQYLVMLALWEQDGQSLRELSRRLRLEPATVSPLVRRLESIGYVSRERRPEDERSLAVTLTPAGRDLRRRALAVPPTMLDRFDLSADELTRINRWLHDLIGRADHALEGTPA